MDNKYVTDTIREIRENAILKAIREEPDYDYNVRNFKNQYLNTIHTEFKVDNCEEN